MWHDGETDVDLLDFRHLVSAILSIANDDKLLPGTIGVFGDWGSGKSSLLKMVGNELKQDKDILCLNFNGWLFEGYEDAKTALMGTILEEIEKNKTFDARAKELASDLFRRIDWMRVVGKLAKYGIAFGTLGPAGLGLASISDVASSIHNAVKDKGKDLDVEKLVAEITKHGVESKQVREGIREYHKCFSDLLNHTKVKKLVVFIDDLDRCTPDSIIETLEAIRLFLFVERTVFIIGADERLVEYAVRRRFPEIPGDRVEVGRDYLEKLIHFPVRIPQLGRPEVETYINLLFIKQILADAKIKELVDKYCELKKKDNSFSLTLNYELAKTLLQADEFKKVEEELAISRQIAPVITAGLNGNPRQCKRFLNTLLMRIEMSRTKKISLDKKVLSKLMLLEYFKSEFFKQLAKAQAEQDGFPKELSVLEGAAEKQKELSEVKGFDTWVTDEWVKDWLLMEPKLGKVDLRPYFHFSRDVLSTFSKSLNRLTPKAQELLGKLLSQSEGVRDAALGEAVNISPAEATTIFEALLETARTTGQVDGDIQHVELIFDFCDKRKELLSQLLTVLITLPESILTPSVPLRMVGLTKGSAFATTAKDILVKWQSSANGVLAQAAKNGLKRF